MLHSTSAEYYVRVSNGNKMYCSMLHLLSHWQCYNTWGSGLLHLCIGVSLGLHARVIGTSAGYTLWYLTVTSYFAPSPWLVTSWDHQVTSWDRRVAIISLLIFVSSPSLPCDPDFAYIVGTGRRNSAENKELRPLVKPDDLIKFPLAWIMF